MKRKGKWIGNFLASCISPCSAIQDVLGTTNMIIHSDRSHSPSLGGVPSSVSRLALTLLLIRLENREHTKLRIWVPIMTRSNARVVWFGVWYSKFGNCIFTQKAPRDSVTLNTPAAQWFVNVVQCGTKAKKKVQTEVDWRKLKLAVGFSLFVGVNSSPPGSPSWASRLSTFANSSLLVRESHLTLHVEGVGALIAAVAY